jgi:hypothetical protein
MVSLAIAIIYSTTCINKNKPMYNILGKNGQIGANGNLLNHYD